MRISNQAESADWFIDDFWYLVYTIFILVQAMMPVLGTAPALLPDDGGSESGLMCFYFWRNGKGGAATGEAPIVT